MWPATISPLCYPPILHTVARAERPVVPAFGNLLVHDVLDDHINGLRAVCIRALHNFGLRVVGVVYDVDHDVRLAAAILAHGINAELSIGRAAERHDCLGPLLPGEVETGLRPEERG